VKKSSKKLKIFRVVIFPLQWSLHSSEIITGNNWLYSVSNKTNRIKICLQLIADSQTPVN